MSLIKEFVAYAVNCIKPKAGSCDVTIVRRYPSATGFVGELYVDGRHIGMTCDKLGVGEEVFRHPLTIGFEQGKRVLRTELFCISRGDFTALIPYNYVYTGSLTPSENDSILASLVDKCSGFKYIRLTVLNRLLVEN